MIATLTLENWRSFRDRVTFSMVASRERQHGHRVARVKRLGARLLPIATIFGGNASGKTNFFLALAFAKFLVTSGPRRPNRPIPVEPFRLDATSTSRPSRFAFEILIHDTLYSYSFDVTSREVLKERLAQSTSRSEHILYTRKRNHVEFHRSLRSNRLLELAFKSTLPNELFLTKSVSMNLPEFLPIYEWFDEYLELIAPDSRFAPFAFFSESGNHVLRNMSEIISPLDTGISRLGTEEVPLENILPTQLVDVIKEELRHDRGLMVVENQYDRYVVFRTDQGLIGKKLVAFHRKDDGSEVKFEISDESDGTRRLIDLIPAFLELSAEASEKVYVVDEFDRSLHTFLTQWLINEYLMGCSESTKKQLILTTHDANLMDQSILRRDEMWAAEAMASGVSELLPFSGYPMRYDTNVRKAYLQGRLGGTPRIVTFR